MGIFRDANNRKKTSEKEKHRRRWKRQEKAAKKAAKGPVPVNIEDPELYSNEMLKNKLKNPRNNIKLSGRNRKRMLKRLKYEMRDEKQKTGEEKKGDFVEDLFMEDAEESGETETPTETTEMEKPTDSASASGSNNSQPSSSGTTSASTLTTKKKKRGGRKKNKGKGDAEGAGQDVEMEELFKEPKWD